MKRNFIWLIMALVVFAVTGCGGGHDDRPLIETVIESIAGVDGDIVEDAATGTRTVTLAGGSPGSSVLAGVDPATGDEYRAFLNFSLSSVPLNASIQSATLNIVIRDVNASPLGASVPMLVELVSFAPPLIPSDFDRAVLLTTTRTISPGSVNDPAGVNINVTSLMVQAQIAQHDNFQVRILQDFVSSPLGVVEIDESNAFAPQLTVVYF